MSKTESTDLIVQKCFAAGAFACAGPAALMRSLENGTVAFDTRIWEPQSVKCFG